MSRKKVLITGISGFIGRNVAGSLDTEKFEITGIVRPKTSAGKLKDFPAVKMVELDLAQNSAIKGYLANNRFDIILHIGALRGGRDFPDRAYYDANVGSTEQFALAAKESEAVMIFCSSVGVYGAIPEELPANIQTGFQEDNYYHYTKIKAEAIIQNMIIKGLKAHIVRPAITYGIGDYGFPYTLTKLISRKLFFYPDRTIKINLANIDLLKEIFIKLTETEYVTNKVYIAADSEPVTLQELSDFISVSLTGKPYPQNRAISSDYFRGAEKFARSFGLNNLLNRIRLISYSWYYDTSATYKELGIKPYQTIPAFRKIVDWYKNKSILPNSPNT